MGGADLDLDLDPDLDLSLPLADRLLLLLRLPLEEDLLDPEYDDDPLEDETEPDLDLERPRLDSFDFEDFVAASAANLARFASFAARIAAAVPSLVRGGEIYKVSISRTTRATKRETEDALWLEGRRKARSELRG